MSFTDKDLKRLKEHMEPWQIFTKEMSVALLARLAAAERAIGCRHIDCGGPFECRACTLERDWRKSAGKPQGEGGR